MGLQQISFRAYFSMEPRRPWSPLFLLFSLSFSAHWWAGESATSGNDVDALHALELAWGPEAVTTLQWTGNDPCRSRWTGITCDGSSPQRVTAIELSGLGLMGDLPDDIGFLNALVTLDMSFNNLTGSIPTLIGQLTQLNLLYLQSNYFNGRIPTQIGQLRSLSTLALNGNRLIGSIPNEIGLLANLSWLDLAQNLLEGALPFSSDGSTVGAGLDNLTGALHFHLNNNSFSGEIPRSMCHPGMRLIHLLLDSNRLEGNIPRELGSCSDLLILKLNNNLLNGAVPEEIGQLTSLNELQVGQNGLVGPLPDLSTLTTLSLLELSNNPLGVEFPSWIVSSRGLTDLNMRNSSVSGQIPEALFGLQTLIKVDLADNTINGSLDLSMATSQLSLVSVENNQIVELNPGSYDKELRLQGNPFCENTGVFPEACVDDSSASAPVLFRSGTTCSNSCPSGRAASPLQCTCVTPYVGILIFRAPTFTSLTNASRMPALATELASELELVDQRQVELSAVFNAQNQLIVNMSIFPSGSTKGWSRDDVMRMSIVLGRDRVVPFGFGPQMFQQISFDYTVVSSNGSGLSTAAKIGIGVGAGLLLLVILALCFWACSQKRRADKATELSKPYVWESSGKNIGAAPQLKGARFFSYAELKKATNNFSESNEIGFGGYGKVYRGILSGGEQVAIKRAQGNSLQGATEFKNEIALLSRVHHKNVVGLVGFCFEQQEQMLVYEYMAGGSLRDCLVGRSGVRLDWRRRIMIALGSARGITYLHELVDPPIIHRDIKSTNILLDERKIAKVADFGLSTLGPGEGSKKQHVSTQVKGTLGYLDPEYYTSMQLTEKSDVYSYGVVLLELLTARAAIEHGKYIVKEVKMAVDQGGLGALRSMLDPRLSNEDLSELNAFVRITLSCVEDAAVDRPKMGEVVKQLEELIGHDYPESGSSNIDVQRGPPVRNLTYGSDSDFLHTSRDSSQPSFPKSTTSSHVPPSFGSR